MIERPDLSELSVSDLVFLMGECGQSTEQSDLEFASFCREEIAKRKPPTKDAP